MNNIANFDWKFIIGDIVIPIVTFILGLFVGKAVEKYKAKSKINGNGNIVEQNINNKNNKRFKG